MGVSGHQKTIHLFLIVSITYFAWKVSSEPNEGVVGANGEVYVNRPSHQEEESGNGATEEIPEEAFFPAKNDAEIVKVVSVDVRCSRTTLNVRMTFDAPFNGVVYSKGHYSDGRCRYKAVQGDANDEAGSQSMEFVIHANTCGTVRSEGIHSNGKAEPYIENTVIIQNTPGIQEASDSARKLRCMLDPHSMDRTVSSSLNVDTLDVISVTYSGDAIDSYMDVQHGKGPFASPVTGLVKIGETLTLVVYVLGGDDYDVRIKDCSAHDGDPLTTIQLTNEEGCVTKPKLMGPWQKTTETGGTGATVMSYAFMEAFKFPDKVEVFLECNIEICKHHCEAKANAKGLSDCYKRVVRTRRNVAVNATHSTEDEDGTVTQPTESAHLMRGIRVVAPEDVQFDVSETSRNVNNGPQIKATVSERRNVVDFPETSRFNDNVCMSTPGFAITVGIMSLCFVGLATITLVLYVKLRQLHPEVELMSSASSQTLHRRNMLASLNSRTGAMPRRKGDF